MKKIKMAVAMVLVMGAVVSVLSACGQTGNPEETQANGTDGVAEISDSADEAQETQNGGITDPVHHNSTESEDEGYMTTAKEDVLESLTGEYDYLSEDGTGRLTIKKTSDGYDISDYESESSWRFLADLSNIEIVEDGRIYLKYPEQVFSDGEAVFGYYILEYDTDGIDVFYGKSVKEAEFLYHASKESMQDGQELIPNPQDKQEMIQNPPAQTEEMKDGGDLLYEAFLKNEISVTNPYVEGMNLTVMDDKNYESEFEDAKKKYAYVDVNSDDNPELIFKISSGTSELMYILGICDDELICFDVFETHTPNLSFGVYDYGIVWKIQNYDGFEMTLYTYTDDGQPERARRFTEENRADIAAHEGEEPEWIDWHPEGLTGKYDDSADSETTAEELLDLFIDGSISAADAADLTSAFHITDLNMDSEEWDSYHVGEKVDLDNDGENELIICGPYGGMYLDARDDRVYKFAEGGGTALILSYTCYNGDIWIMYSNRSSAGFEFYHMEKYEGADNLVAEMNFGEEFDIYHAEEEDGVKYTLNGAEISYDEYTALCSKIFAAEVSTN